MPNTLIKTHEDFNISNKFKKGKNNEYGFGIRVNDIVKPEIKVSGSLPAKLKLNTTFEMPIAIVSDNYSSAIIQYYCMFLYQTYLSE